MYYRISLLIMLCCGSLSFGGSPLTAGFFTGPDSTVYIYWYHSDIYNYEQGIDGILSELPFIAGEQPNVYRMAQQWSFPYLTQVTTFRIKIYNGDLFPQSPGDQYSPFSYGIYRESADTLPIRPALLASANMLCSGEICNDEWVDNSLGLPDLAGNKLWFEFSWTDATPTAPQIYTVFPPLPEPRTLIGTGTQSETYHWERTGYIPVFRIRFAALFPCDTDVTVGWRRPMATQSLPDSFLIVCYRGTDVFQTSVLATDTLIYPVAKGALDSAIVSTCANGRCDGAKSMASFDQARTLPIASRIERIAASHSGAPYDANLVIENLGSQTLNLRLGYDHRYISADSDSCLIPYAGQAIIPIHCALPWVSDGVPSPIVITDAADHSYPFLMWRQFRSVDPTDTNDPDTRLPLPGISLTALPNPSSGTVTFRVLSPAGSQNIDIFNIVGQKVAAIRALHGNDILWDGRGFDCRRLPRGVYLARLGGERKHATAVKVILLY